MAKIIVTVDTEQDAIDVNIDGVTQSNVKEVCFYLYEDPYDGDTELSTRISLMEKNKESGLTTMTCLIAEDITEGKLVKAAADEPYGDVKYADPGYQNDKKKRYPIDTEEHIRSAWNYINKEKNSDKYSAEQLKKIKAKIVSAWKSKIDKEGPPSAEASVAADIANYFRHII